MTIKFNIEYNTSWGEELYITGSTASLGNNDIKRPSNLPAPPLANGKGR